jgi:hypothetical protein
MSYQEDTIDWQAIELVDKWLDESPDLGHRYHHNLLAQDWGRISKVAEELGEAIQAFIGYTGQNPRKGETHELADVLDELADTAATAIFAIQHFTKSSNESRQIIRNKIGAIYARMPK